MLVDNHPRVRLVTETWRGLHHACRIPTLLIPGCAVLPRPIFEVYIGNLALGFRGLA